MNEMRPAPGLPRKIFLSDMGFWPEMTGSHDLDGLLKKRGAGLETIRFSISDNLDCLEKTIFGMREQLKRWGDPALNLHGPFLDLNPACYDTLLLKAVSDRFSQAYEAGCALNAEKIIFHSGRIPGIYRFHSAWEEQMILFWRHFLEHRSGLTVCMENVLDEYPQPLLHVAEQVDSPDFGICLDLGHANCYSKVPVEEWIRVLAPHLKHVHLHDNMGEEDLHLALGRGTIPYRKYLRMLRELCPDASFTLECAKTEELKASYDYLEKADGMIK